MLRNVATIIASAMLALAPLAVSAQINPGTVLTGTIDQELSSASAQVGQTFTVSGVNSQDREVAGAEIYGHIAAVTRAGQGRPGMVTLAYDRMRLPSGDVYSLVGSDTISAQIKTKSNELKEVGGVVVGALLGRLVGGAVGASLVGTVFGATAGYTIAKNNRTNVTIPKDSTVVLQVNRSLRRQQAR